MQHAAGPSPFEVAGPARGRPPAPLLPVALGMMLGVSLDYALAPPAWLALLPAAAGLAFWRLHARWPAAAPWCVVFLAVSLGAVCHAISDRWLAADHVVQYSRAEPALARIHGRVITVPQVLEPEPNVPRAYDRGPRTRFLIEAQAIRGAEDDLPASGRLAVNVRAPVGGLGLGDVVAITGWLYRIPPPSNPGAYDWRLHHRRSGIYAGLVCDHAESVQIVARNDGLYFSRTLQALRDYLRGYLVDAAFDHDDPGAGVLEAMVLGQRSAVPRAIDEAFIRTGNSHFLAASGTNVGWMALLGWWLLSRLGGLHYRTTALAVAGLILLYVLVAEPQPSIWRAGVVGLIGCLSVYRSGRPNIYNWLSCAAVLILLFDPPALFRPAFQLSFLAVIALADVEPTMARAVGRAFAAIGWTRLAQNVCPARFHGDAATERSLSLERSPTGAGLADRVIRLLPLRLATASFAIWLTALPVAMYHFNALTPWAWFGTIVLWVIIVPLTYVGFFSLVVGTVLPSAGVVTGPILEAGTRLVLGAVDLLARLPGTFLPGRSPSLAWVAATYAVMAWAFYRPRRAPPRRLLPVAVAILIAWWLIPPRWVHRQPDALVAWFLAVGDGAATIIELPDGRVIAYDIGTRSPFDAGPTVRDFLTSRGIDRIDTVYVSHADFDHYSGIETLLRHVAIGRVVVNDQFEPFAPAGSSAARFLTNVRRAGIPLEIVVGPGPLDFGPGVDAQIIWPPPLSQQRFARQNDASMVIKLTWQGRSILLTGDVDYPAIAGLLHAHRPLALPSTTTSSATSLPAAEMTADAAPYYPVDLTADVLALPHHGSVQGNTAALINAVDPSICIRSAGQRRAMTTNGIDQLCRGRRYFSTADDGCVKVAIRGGQVESSGQVPGAVRLADGAQVTSPPRAAPGS